jgi:hypothetical protein
VEGQVLKTATLPAGLALLSPGFTLRSRLQRPLLVAGTPAPTWTVLSMRRCYLDDVMPLLLLLLCVARSERCPRQERMAAWIAAPMRAAVVKRA